MKSNVQQVKRPAPRAKSGAIPAKEPSSDPNSTADGLRLSIARLEHVSREQRIQISRLRTEVLRLEEDNRRLKPSQIEPLAVLNEPDAQLLLALQMSALDNDGADPESLQLAMALQNSAADEVQEAGDAMTYEEMLAISEQLGSVPVGLKPHQLRRLPRVLFSSESALNDTCTVCMVAFSPGEQLLRLPKCRHLYHARCISTWFKSKKTCPMCHVEAA